MRSNFIFRVILGRIQNFLNKQIKHQKDTLDFSFSKSLSQGHFRSKLVLRSPEVTGVQKGEISNFIQNSEIIHQNDAFFLIFSKKKNWPKVTRGQIRSKTIGIGQKN